MEFPTHVGPVLGGQELLKIKQIITIILNQNYKKTDPDL